MFTWYVLVWTAWISGTAALWVFNTWEALESWSKELSQERKNRENRRHVQMIFLAPFWPIMVPFLGFLILWRAFFGHPFGEEPKNL